MELPATALAMNNSSVHVGARLPITPTSDMNEPESFRVNFQKHMPSSRKPISHDSTSVLLLSYDSNEEGFADFDVRNEASCNMTTCTKTRLIGATGCRP